jgi:hypothetical protein
MCRKKKNDIDKKLKTNISINEKLNEMLEEHLDEIDENKSRFIEKILKDHIENK